MQLTNIARDVDEDARRGHRYLPEAWVGPVTPQQIVDPDPETKHILRQASRRLLDRAEIYYRSADHGLGHLPARARFAILVAGRVYRQIGVSIARQDHAPWQGRARVSRPEKLQVAAGAALSFLGRPHLHARDAVHDRTLHEALAGLPGTHPAGP
jgi:phytoene synthase